MFIYFEMLLIGIATVFTILSFSTKTITWSNPADERRSKGADLEYYSNPAYSLFAWILWLISGIYAGALTLDGTTYPFDDIAPLTFLFYGFGMIGFVEFFYTLYLWLTNKLKL